MGQNFYSMETENFLKLFSFFSLGFFGGFSHCVFMCNPFVLYVASRFNLSAKGYFSLLIPQIKYNSGRILTYSLLGVVVGFVSDIGIFLTKMSELQKITAVIWGIFLIFYGVSDFFGFQILSRMENNFLTRKISGKIGKVSLSSPFAVGILLGFLPCGLLYGALIGVFSLKSPFFAGFGMMFFGIGTSFALILVALFGNFILRYRKLFRFLSMIVMVVMGIFFIYSGWKF